MLKTLGLCSARKFYSNLASISVDGDLGVKCGVDIFDGKLTIADQTVLQRDANEQTSNTEEG